MYVGRREIKELGWGICVERENKIKEKAGIFCCKARSGLGRPFSLYCCCSAFVFLLCVCARVVVVGRRYSVPRGGRHNSKGGGRGGEIQQIYALIGVERV